ncbi:MAG: tRNA (cytidine(34)-2'-O)-methyltransferase [Alphaproteobacteria bacterium]|nr:tRNA (cytidine(34)-2'-O)-methyltransferase [Alphaproteobacteria bacterium]
MIRLALYQPDIPQNVGAAIRLCACLGMELDIIEPCGFPWDDARIRRSAMDYGENLRIARHESWDRFQGATAERRRILLTTKGAICYTGFTFRPDDILLAGRESAGVPDFVHESADGRVLIPMAPGARSLNLVNACAMVAGEALRQTHPLS